MEKIGRITVNLSDYSKYLDLKRNWCFYTTANNLLSYKYEYLDIFKNRKLESFLYDLIKETHERIKTQKFI